MTSNPSEEQLELVQGRILELSSALYPYVGLDEDGNSYFDEVRSLRHTAPAVRALPAPRHLRRPATMKRWLHN